MPYGTSRAELLQHEPLDPFHDGSRLAGSAGGDLRMPLGSRLTLSATVNPDFGQVEVDPAATSLSGLGGRPWLNKEKGSWMSNSSVGFLIPGLEMNDLGYLSQTDLIGAHVGTG
jgi:hypothetical protein